MRSIDTSKITDIELEGIDTTDYPDFTDAFIISATWSDTREPLTDEEMDELNEHGEFVYECVMSHLF